ncbi:Nmad5 family putative nucleotide modification protein [Burkholderia sp. 22088]|uniref:Nmad5 family putative nucleotide modification protein n=1 Tax=Burkholderia sp. 22088 TaxID=3453871 RepID=UPI003F86E25B
MSTNVKLSNHVRDQIISNAMKGAFEKEKKAVAKQLQDLAMACYRSQVSAEEEAAARRAPEEFLTLSNTITLAFRDENGSRTAYYSSVDLPKIVPFKRGGGTYLTISDKKLNAKKDAYEKAHAELEEKFDELRNSIRGMVYSATTVKKLLDIWPESVNFLPANLEKPAPALPAVIATDLNNALKKAGVRVGVIKRAAQPKGGLVAVAA